MLKSKGARLFGSAGLIVGARVTRSLLTLFYISLLAGVAPAEEVGRVFAALSAGFLLSVVASLNTEAGSIRFLPLYFEKDRREDAAGFILYCRYVVLAVCALFLTAAGLAFLAGYRPEGLGPYFFSLAAAPVIANERINSRHATALGRVLQGALPRILVRPILMSVTLSICLAYDMTLDATTIMGIFFAASCIGATIQWLVIRHAMAFRKEVTPTFGEARGWSTLGVMLSPMLVMNEYMRDVIIMASSLVLAQSDLARLGISLSLVGVLNFGVTAFDMIFSPRISKAIAQDKPRQAARLLTFCGAAKIAALSIGVPLAYVLLPYVLDLMGSEYQGIEFLFLILVFIPLSNALFGPANVVLNITGHRWELLLGAMIGLGLLVVLATLGGVQAGLTGVAVGAAAGMTGYQIVLYVLCRMRAGIDTTVLSMRVARAG